MVDWKPFDYFTYASQGSDAPKPELLITRELTTMTASVDTIIGV